MPFAPIEVSGGQVTSADSLATSTSSVVNWELDSGGINRVRPALATYSVTGLPAGTIVGSVWWNGYTILVVDTGSGRYLYTIADVTPTVAVAASSSTVTTQLQGMSRPTFVAGADYVYVAGGWNIIRWAPTLAYAETLTSSPRCTHIAAIGARLVANDIESPSVFRWSDIGEGTWDLWPAANEQDADSRPDPVVGVFENLNELYVWGSSSLQVYQVGSDPLFPFERVATTDTGLAAPYAVIRYDDGWFYLDHHRRFVQGDGRATEVISDDIATTLRGLGTIDDCWGYREEIDTGGCLVWRFPTETMTLVLDLGAKKWNERKRYVAPFQADWPANCYVYRASDNTHLIGSSISSGGLYQLTTDEATDAGSIPIVCERVTGWHDHGSFNRKRSSRVRVALRRGTAAQGAEPGSLEVRVQDDDSPWSGWQQISVGGPDQYEHTQDLFFGGIYRRRRYGFRWSNSEAMAFVAAFDEVAELKA